MIISKLFQISKLFLFFNIISLKTDIFIPAKLQRHYPVPVVVLRKICKIPRYSCSRLLIRRQTLSSEEEFEFWEETEVRGSQILGKGWMFQQFVVQFPYFSHCQNTFVGGCIVLIKDDFFFWKPGIFSRFFCV